jgi:fermentation-respiration switch protein FrsA (DUF1100 family)
MSESRTPSWKPAALRCVAYPLGAYVGLIAMLMLIENRLLYHPTSPEQRWIEPPVADIQDIELTSTDGTRLHAWWLPQSDSDIALLYCHGNAGNLSYRGGSIAKLRERLGVSVLIIDYPGYGKSEGVPSESGCYAAADAAYDWLTQEKQFAPKRLLLFGASMGGGVITHVASRREHHALILVKTFTSAPDIAADIYWWLPVPKRAIMTNHFDSIARIDQCKRPLFLAHGTADEVIPYSHGERLFKAANEPKRFLSMPGADHNSQLPEMFFDSLKEFLRAHPVE